MDNVNIALAVAIVYCVMVVFVHPASIAIAEYLKKILAGRYPVLGWIPFAVRFGFVFLLVWVFLILTLKFCGKEDLAQVFGLQKIPRKGKVVMTIPRNVMGAGVDITEPYLHYQNSPTGEKYFLSFKFKIFKGAKDKELKITGGRFIIRAVISGRPVDQQEFPMDGGFAITDQELTGTYVSPRSFQLRVKPEAIQLVWELDRWDGKKVVSKTISLEPLLMGN